MAPVLCPVCLQQRHVGAHFWQYAVIRIKSHAGERDAILHILCRASTRARWRARQKACAAAQQLWQCLAHAALRRRPCKLLDPRTTDATQTGKQHVAGVSTEPCCCSVGGTPTRKQGLLCRVAPVLHGPAQMDTCECVRAKEPLGSSSLDDSTERLA